MKHNWLAMILMLCLIAALLPAAAEEAAQVPVQPLIERSSYPMPRTEPGTNRRWPP